MLVASQWPTVPSRPGQTMTSVPSLASRSIPTRRARTTVRRRGGGEQGEPRRFDDGNLVAGFALQLHELPCEGRRRARRDFAEPRRLL